MKPPRSSTDAHRTPEFLAQNDWTAHPERVRQLAQAGRREIVFLCGSMGNDANFGTKPHELELVLAWHELIDEHYLGQGAIFVDATQPLPRVVDEMLSSLDEPR